MKKWMILILTLAMMASLTAGVALAAENETEGEDAPAAETTEAPAEETDPFEGLVRLGEETEGCWMVKLTNQAETNIMMVNVKRSDDWQWSDNLLLDGDTLDVGESAVLCLELPGTEETEDAEAPEAAAEEEQAPEEAPAEGEQTEEGTEPEQAEPVLYDLQIIYVDWTGGTCHNVVLADVQDAQIMRAWNSIPYLVYTSVETGEAVDMQDAEQQIAMEEYYASQAASSSSGSGSSSSSSNSGGCVGDGGLFY